MSRSLLVCAITMSVCSTVYEIFNVKEWRDLETGDMALFNTGRSYFIIRLSVGRPL